MPIALDKILTISAGDWCEMYGENISDYRAVGIILIEEPQYDEVPRAERG